MEHAGQPACSPSVEDGQRKMKTSSEPHKDPGQYDRQPLLKAKDVAVRLLVSEKTVHKLVRGGRLACVQVTSRDRRFTDEQVQEYIRSQSSEARVDKRTTPTVSSRPKKGGDSEQSVGVDGKDLREEMRRWR